MQYSSLVAFALLAVLISLVPQLAQAQTSTRETCDEQVCHIKITKDGYVPKTLVVKIGATIIWTNVDDGSHTVTSGSPGEITSPLKSLLLEKESTYQFTFEYSGLYEGSYKYFDQITKTMRGEIVVQPELEKNEGKPVSQTMTVDYSDPNSGVKKVSLTNGNVLSMEIDPNFNSLRIIVQTVDASGKMELILARSLIDSQANGEDSDFLLLIDGEVSPYEEVSKTPIERSLLITVPRQTGELELVGTSVSGQLSSQQMTATTPYGEKVALSWAPEQIESDEEVVFTLQFFDKNGNPVDGVEYDLALMREGTELKKRPETILQGISTEKFTFTDDQLGRVTLRVENINNNYGDNVEFSLLVVPEFPFAVIVMASIFGIMMMISFRQRELFRLK